MVRGQGSDQIESIRVSISALTPSKLEEVSEALLDFPDVAALQQWLETN